MKRCAFTNITSKMRHVILILFLASICSYSYSQNKVSTILELGGASGRISLNAEYALMQKDKFQINVRAGFGYLPQRRDDFYTIPIGGNLIYTLKNRHHIETGLAISYMEGLTSAWYNTGDDGLVFTEKALYFSPSIGYRYDKLETGLILRFCYSPLIVLHDYLDWGEIDNAFERVYGPSASPYAYDTGTMPVAKNYFGFVSISVGFRF